MTVLKKKYNYVAPTKLTSVPTNEIKISGIMSPKFREMVQITGVPMKSSSWL
jgi:hypothetical protein